MRVDWNRERAWWDAKACVEERDGLDEAVNRALRWREIERHLAGVSTILDVGGATGAFSIPLARRGFQVTHLDFSSAMLDIARQDAAEMPNIQFVEANAVDLSRFKDRAFDLVLNTDGAISFCGAEAERALRESCRVTRLRLIVTVSNRGRMLAAWASHSLSVTGTLGPSVYAMLERGEWHQDAFPEGAALSVGCTQDYLGTLHAFTRTELEGVLRSAGMRVLRCGGLGSLCALVPEETIHRIAEDERLSHRFVELCERFDHDVMPDGPGTRQRAGLIAVAERLD